MNENLQTLPQDIKVLIASFVQTTHPPNWECAILTNPAKSVTRASACGNISVLERAVAIHPNRQEALGHILFSSRSEEVDLWATEHGAIPPPIHEQLFYAVLSPHARGERIRQLVRTGAEAAGVSERDFVADVAGVRSESLTLLHLASISGNAGSIRAIVDSGIDVHTTDLLNRNALHWAALMGHVSVARELMNIDNTCVHAIDYDGKTPVDLATSFSMKQFLTEF